MVQGTPSSQKEVTSQPLRFQVNLVPGIETPSLPSFAHHPLRLGHRWYFEIDSRSVLEAIRWAQDQRLAGVVEEYLLGAITLEDLYIRRIGREDALDRAG